MLEEPESGCQLLQQPHYLVYRPLLATLSTTIQVLVQILLITLRIYGSLDDLLVLVRLLFGSGRGLGLGLRYRLEIISCNVGECPITYKLDEIVLVDE